MNKSQENNSRREILKNLLKSAGLMGIGGAAWGGIADGLQASELTLRPPAAITKKEFEKACIRCGSCVEACPYNTLMLATPEDRTAIGTPFFKPRSIPCYLCPDAPCVKDCPSGALDINLITDKESNELDINKSKIGVAVIDQNSCIAFWGIQCDACYRACPLIGEAINLKFERNDRTGKHAIIEPVINREVCTGCGLCEHACITEKPSIMILPVDVASGKTGAHYIRSWNENDEKKINSAKEKSGKVKKTAEDYLNDSESLFDD